MESMAHLVSSDKARIEAINTEFQGLRHKISDTDADNKAKDSEIKRLQQALDTSHKENETQERQHQERLAQVLVKHTDAIETLENERSSLQHHANILENNIRQLENNNKSLSDEKISLHGVLSFLREENNQLQQTLSSANADRAGLQDSTLQFVVEIGQLKGYVKELEEKCEAYQVLY